MFWQAGRFWKDQTGSPIMEAAVVFPFVLVLGLGAIEFGYALYQYQIVQASLRSGGRYLARIPVANWNDLVPGDSQGKTYEQYAISLTVRDSVTDSPRVKGWNLADVTISPTITDNCTSIQGNCLNYYNGGPQVSALRISTNFVPEGLGFASLIGLSSGLRINASHEERVIGQ